MTSEAGEDVWGDEDFLNALIVATENASAASSSSAGASLPLPGTSTSHVPGNAVPTFNDHTVASTSSRVSPYERTFSDSFLLPPPPRPVRVAPRAPPPVSLASNGTQAAWQEWDDFFADGNLGLLDVGFDSRACDFSPPKELSQRAVRTEPKVVVEDPRAGKAGGREFSSVRRIGAEKDKDKQIERLKREMDTLLKKLDSMEREHCKLHEDRSKKDEELEHALSEIHAKSVEIENLKKEIFGKPSSKTDHRMNIQKNSLEQVCDVSYESIAPSCDPSPELHPPEEQTKKRRSIQSDPADSSINNGVRPSTGHFIQGDYHPMKSIQLPTTKTIGIQTELVGTDLPAGKLHQIHDVANKMLSIWGSITERKTGRYFISRLLGCCSEDLCILFRFIGVPSNEVVLDDLKCSTQSVEAQKVSQLYSIIMKVKDEILHLDNLLEALIDLCELGNVIIAFRSLRILRALLHIIYIHQSIQSVLCSGIISSSIHLELQIYHQDAIFLQIV